MVNWLFDLRGRLLLLVLLAVFPGLLLVLDANWAARENAKAEAQKETGHLAAFVAEEQNRVIEQSRQLLIVLSRLPAVGAAAGSPACSATLARIRESSPTYGNLGVVDRQGNMLCSALPYKAGMNIADRSWFRRAIDSRGFAIGDYLIGRISGKPSLTLALPMLDASGAPGNVLFAAVDLSWFAKLSRSLALPPGTAMALVDANGSLLARYPELSNAAVGQPTPHEESLEAIIAHGCRGHVDLTGVDGVRRLNAIVPLQMIDGGRCIYARVGVPTEAVYGPAARQFRNGMLTMLIVGLLAFAVAWFGGDWLVLRRMRALTDAARRVGEGDLDARSGLPHRGDEIAQLAKTFDETAERLQDREARLLETDRILSHANRALAVLSAGNRAMLHATDEPSLLHEMCRMIVENGGYPMAWVGYREGDRADRLRAVAHYGFEVDRIDPRSLAWDPAAPSFSVTDAVLRSGRPELFRAGADREALSCMRELGCAAALGLPLIRDGKVFGVLSIYGREAEAFDDGEIELLNEAADDLAFGIGRLRDRVRSLEADEIEDLYNKAPCGYHSLDKDGRVVRINDTELEWLGYRRDEVVGQMAFADLVSPESRALFAESFHHLKATGRVGDLELDMLRRDGTRFPVLLNALAICDEAGNYLSSRSTLFDITDRKRADLALRQAKDAAEETTRIKSEFLANMSHELRTPLNAIIGFSEVLKDGLMGELLPEQKEYVTDIFSSGQHLLSLINDILDLSKIEAGKMTLDLELLDIGAMLNNSLSIVKEKALSHRLSLRLEIAESLGAVLLDVRKTKQIAYNLLSNGVKFTPEGGQVRLRANKVSRRDIESWSAAEATCLRMPLPEGSHGEFLEISVEDTGIGVAPEDAPRLFHAFSQLDSSLSRETEGTGLGLTLVLKLAQLHGGTAALASTPGRGSRFVVWLPWRNAGSALGSVQPIVPSPVMSHAGHLSALLIEDNPRAAELIRLQLEPEGFEIIVAGTAHEGLELLATRPPPTVIILDILLPDIDGWELLARIKGPGSPSVNVPVVIVSIVADTHKGFFLGASAVLQKPVSREELIKSMDDLGLTSANRSIEVLVVDDDPKAVELLSAYLAEPGYTVLRAYGGQEGIARTRNDLPDLVVLDLMMPGISGFDVVKALKTNPETVAIPIIVVTAKILTAEDRAILNGYVVAILEKASFNHGHFAREVRRALTAHRSPEV